MTPSPHTSHSPGPAITEPNRPSGPAEASVVERAPERAVAAPPGDAFAGGTDASARAASGFDRPEIRLLLASARTALSEAEERHLHRLAAADLDWEFAFGQAVRHGVAALMVHHLHRLGLTHRVPEAVREPMQQYTHAVLRHNVHATSELVRVLRTLQSADLRAMPFKGPILADRFYGNLAFRRFVDLDLIVRRRDFARVRDALVELGYEPFRTLTPEGEAALLDAQLGYEMIHRECGVVVELHWAFLNRTFNFPLDPDQAWTRSGTTRLGGMPVQTLSTEDLLLYLCAHGAKHYWAGLKWACDVAEVLRNAEVDWSTLRRRAEEMHVSRLLHLGLHLAERWLDAPVPPSMQRRIAADPVVDRLAEDVETGWLFTDDPLEAEVSLRKIRFTVATRQRLRDSLSFLWHHAGLIVQPTEQDRAFVDLPDALSLGYLVVRPIRVVAEWVQSRRLSRS